MIRFIDLRASNIGEYAFAWIIEETDCFLEINGSQAWDGWTDFVQDCRTANKEQLPLILGRHRRHFPEWLQQEIRDHYIGLITNDEYVDTMIVDDPLRRDPAAECDLPGIIEWWEGSGVYKKKQENKGSVDWTGA